jgi:predicted deacetylase
MIGQPGDTGRRTARRPLLIVSVHDVAPASLDACRAWAAQLEPLSVPLTLLAIPGPWRGSSMAESASDDPTATWLRTRQDRGDEVAVHGWSHTADVAGRRPRAAVGRAVARGAAEFWTLDREAAAERTRRGVAVLSRHGLQITGTTPPGWLASRDAVRGFADAGLRYTTDHASVLDLSTGRRWRAPVVCHRPSRRGTTRRSVTEDMGRHLVDVAWRSVVLGRSLRIGLHPDDLDRLGLAATVLRTIRRCLDAGALAVTYRDVIERSACDRA